MRCETWVDLIFLDMVGIDALLSMEWLSLYQAILDFYGNIMTLATLNMLRLSYKCSLNKVQRDLYLF